MAVGLTFWSVVTLSSVAPVGSAQPSGCPRQGEVHVCQAEGFGTIPAQDVAQARDKGLIDARRRALEQVAVVQVDAETITRNQALFDQLVRRG